MIVSRTPLRISFAGGGTDLRNTINTTIMVQLSVQASILFCMLR